MESLGSSEFILFESICMIKLSVQGMGEDSHRGIFGISFYIKKNILTPKLSINSVSLDYEHFESNYLMLKEILRKKKN